MSIKPIFAKQIYDKVKGYELRRKLFPIFEGDHIILYETAPVKSITGEFIAGEVKELNSDKVVNLIRKGLLRGCNELDIPYVIGERKVLVIEVKSPRAFKCSLSLDDIKNIIKDFHPPRSYFVIKSKKLLRIIERLTYIAQPGYVDPCELFRTSHPSIGVRSIFH